MTTTYKPPFPYFGGKSKIASEVWSRFGAVNNYIEPFFGSGACMFLRPTPFDGVETVNDVDGMVANFWRAVQSDPEAVAHHADWPANENDLHARHAWLVERSESLRARLEGDPDYCDARIAGWWCWGMALWIGGAFVSGSGPWRRVRDGGGNMVLRRDDPSGRRADAGLGVQRQLIHVSDSGRGVQRRSQDLRAYIQAISDRLRRVRVCCGDWSRVCTPAATTYRRPSAILLDPPYSHSAGRYADLYTCESADVSRSARDWAVSHGDDPNFRIALCGYEGEHDMPESWECVAWKTRGGYSSKRSETRSATNADRERIWFSPHCIKSDRGLML